MMNSIIVLGVILVLAILYLIFRVGSLVTVAKGEQDSRVEKGNSVHGALFIVFMVVSLTGFFWYSHAYFDDYNLPLASEHGAVTDKLFWITMGITVVAFTIISIVMFVFIYKYRYNSTRKAAFFPDNHYLELTWTIIPGIVLAVLVFTGLRAWNDITAPASKNAEVIELIGQQFAWTARYPGKDKELGKVDFRRIDDINEFGFDLNDANAKDDFKSLELHIPVNKEILLKIRAKDVLHSVYLPHFRVKMDAVPGMPTHFKFKATKTTQEMRDELGNQAFNYEMACTEICGRGHFSMRFPVVVETEEDYERWKLSQESWFTQNQDYVKQKQGTPAQTASAGDVK